MMTRKTKLFRMLCLALLCAGVVWGVLTGGAKLAAQPAQSTNALGELVSMRMHAFCSPMTMAAEPSR